MVLDDDREFVFDVGRNRHVTVAGGIVAIEGGETVDAAQTDAVTRGLAKHQHGVPRSR